MSGLINLPLCVTEMEGCPAFGSDDAALVRASIYLLDAAWRSRPIGSISTDVQAIARATRLDVAQVERNWDKLFAGWELREDGRLWHPGLANLGQVLQERYARVLQEMEAAAALMVQPLAGEVEMDLLGDGSAPKKASSVRGKRSYPKDFVPNEASRAAMLRAGYVTEQEQAWLLQKFADFGQAQRRMYADWQAAFRNFLSSSITARDFREAFGRRLVAHSEVSTAQRLPAGVAALDRLRAVASAPERTSSMLSDTFAQRQLNNARTMMAAALARRQSALAQEDVDGVR